MQGQMQLSPEEEAEYTRTVEHILNRANDILAALGVTEVVDNIDALRMDDFYILAFQGIFQQELGLVPGETEQMMAANIDEMLNMIEEAMPEIDIETLNGDMIVEGDLSQIVMMLELITELIRMTEGEGEGDEEMMEEEKQHLEDLPDPNKNAMQQRQEEIMKQNNGKFI